MGVSGSGKTTIGRALATRLGWSFEEGDALHPPENIAKMRAGQPLTDADRAPWLSAIAARIDEWRRRSESGVITCSALKRSYRQVIIGDRREVRLVYLSGSRELIAERMSERHDHFMPASLLDSQFETLEPPTGEPGVLRVDALNPISQLQTEVAAWLHAKEPS